MDADYSRVRGLFEQAIGLPAPERSPFLDDACAGDPALRARIEAMLATAEGDDAFLSEPEARPATGTTSEPPPTSIGPYKLLQMIGEGGFGAVFLAEQQEPVRRRVALKIIKLGMDTRQVIARFEAERQALAMMDHPNIARVLDAGATDGGRPYFVMELVRGEPITAYCDRERLGIRERVELAIQVCHAVEHAHQKGVIHRDLKPSNILVTVADGRPIPKVIDFGIAKATSARLTEKTLFTEHRQLIGTPVYMSPEQAELSGVDVDTRSDIYSLGVLLYELLAGAPPFDPERLRSAAFGEMQRIIREEDPPRPSTRVSTLVTLDRIATHRRTEPARLGAVLRGDLDWIIMTALEKDRARRYQAAGALAADLGRHLAGEPVLAVPPTRLYRARKFVRRHRTGLGVAAAGVAALSVAAGGGMYGALAARAGARDARRHAEVVEAVNDFLAHDLLGSIVPEGEHRPARGRDVLLRDVLDAAASNLDEATAGGGRLAGSPLVEAALRQAIGDAYLGLGEHGRADPHLHRSVDLHARELGATHRATLRARAAISTLYREQGEFTRAIDTSERLILDAERTLGPGHAQTARFRSFLGSLLTRVGRYSESEAHLVAAFGTLEHALGRDHPETLNAGSRLGELYRQTGRLAEAESLFAAIADASARTLGAEHPSTLGHTSNFAALFYDQGRFREAEPLMVRVLETRRRVLGPEHPHTLEGMLNLANVRHELGDAASAESLERTMLEIQERTLGPEHPSTLFSLMHLGQTLYVRGALVEAEEKITRALEAQRRVLGEEHVETLLSLENLAQVHLAARRYPEAEAHFRSAIDIGLRLFGPRHARPLGSRTNLASLYLRTGRLEEAEALYRESLEAMRPALGLRHPYTRICMRGLAQVLEARGQPEEAESLRAEVREWEAADAGAKPDSRP